MFQFDTSVHLSDLVLFGGGILAFLRVWLSMRDTLRDHTRDIARIDSTVKDLDQTLDEQGRLIQQHESMLGRLGFNRFTSGGPV